MYVDLFMMSKVGFVGLSSIGYLESGSEQMVLHDLR